MVVQVFADEHWNAYHDIRRAVLFEARGLIGYDANHPDDRRDGHFPLLLLLENTPVGAARLDLMSEQTAWVRTVAIRAECQGKGTAGCSWQASKNSHHNTGSRDCL
ncbi:GNAT family N-acetyltransferase [Rhizobium leguminosarum]|uniref:GNAT family N-acetyltransferase n=1 Tax=Rhizobium leguminosarum TaxID=384 RepID=UPI001FDED8F4|nr:GNAT family N-acetyltransferase [Rhizobium leguminosarum]